MNVLAWMDLYKPMIPLNGYYPSSIKPLTISDNALPEYQKLKHIQEIAYPKSPNDLIITPNGVYNSTQLQPEQLVCIISGFIGLSDEFSYDKGIENAQMSLFGTKFIVDLTGEPQLAFNFRRSLTPNCFLKFFAFRGEIHVGIFAGIADANGIDNRTRKEKYAVEANSELTLPIDFPPGTMQEPIDYMNWHFDEVEIPQEPPSSPPPAPPVKEAPRRGRPPKDPSRVDRMEKDKEKEKKKKKAKALKEEKESKGKPGRKRGPRGSNVDFDANDTFMFNLFKTDEPGVPYFEVYPTYQEEEEDYNEEEEMASKFDDQIPIPDDCKGVEETSVIIPDTPVDLSFLDEMKEVGDCSFVHFKVNDPTDEFLCIMHE